MARGRATSLSHRGSIPTTIYWPGKALQAQLMSLVICDFQCRFTVAPVLTLCTVICMAGYKNPDATSSFAGGDLGCLCYTLPSRKKCCLFWVPAALAAQEGQKATTIGLVLAEGGDGRGYRINLIASSLNPWKAGRALIPREVKTGKRASSSPCRQGWGWHNGGTRKPLLTNTITGVFFYLSVKVYFCYSNLSSILIHAECIARALGNNPESNFGIQIIWFICIGCIYPHYNCTWKTQKYSLVYTTTHWYISLLQSQR